MIQPADAQPVQPAFPPAPNYRLVVAGREITPAIERRLIDLVLTDNRGGEADQLELVLDDSDGALEIPPKGAEIHLALGWAGEQLIDKGRFVVAEARHSGAPDQLSIRANSADLRSTLTHKREQSWHDTTIGAIVRSIASRNALTAVIAQELDARYITHVDQTDESDISFLTRLARDFDGFAAVKAARLLFMAAGQGTTASGTPLKAVTITRQDGDRHDFSVADRDAYTGVRAYWHDTRTGQRESVLVGEGINEDPTPAPGSGGVKALTRVFASQKSAQRAVRAEWERLQRSPNPKAYSGVRASWKDKKSGKSGTELAGGDGKPPAPPLTEPSADSVKTLRHTYASKHNALRAARAEWQRLQRGAAKFSIELARGRPELIPELPATVRGWKPQIDGEEWIIVRLTHRLNDSGLTTAVEFEVNAAELAE